ncbi:MAG: UDP-N-acetylmuramoyl-L-alanine--D-glutamate ligase [Ketobacteraceae bacterium]|nr:UDP-N-acetylmuramoyl-L-alanine--D-glutamate ligase [Ketobacteraceae bacterium]
MATEKNATYTVVVGLGKTGKSCVRFLKNKGVAVVAVDTRNRPPGLDELVREFPDLEFRGGSLNSELLEKAQEIIVSPGLSMREPALQSALAAGVPVIGDIALFRRYVKDDIVAITGSNAKSTVTSLVGKLLQDAGINAVVAGNIGIPVMELLNQGVRADVYVLELSSFQLETTADLKAKVATVLNLSEDHMDRYESLEEYGRAKQRIYEGCETAVINRDDPHSEPVTQVKNKVYFGASTPGEASFGLIDKNGEIWLSLDHSPLIRASALKIKGRHNQVNALAAVAIGHALAIPMESMICTLEEFEGLPHRCQWVANVQGVDWFNDSKGTNVGAAVAAINGIGADTRGKLILIAGGEGKDADFSLLKSPVKRYVRKVILIGRDAALIASEIAADADVTRVRDLQEAVSLAHHEAKKQDAVVLSPACASFDMFDGFEDRGNQFMQLVHGLEART